MNVFARMAMAMPALLIARILWAHPFDPHLNPIQLAPALIAFFVLIGISAIGRKLTPPLPEGVRPLDPLVNDPFMPPVRKVFSVAGTVWIILAFALLAGAFVLVSVLSMALH